MREKYADKIACRYQVMIGHPYDRYFKYMVSNSMLQNLPITATDAKNDHTIWYRTLLVPVRRKCDRIRIGQGTYQDVPLLYKPSHLRFK